MGWKSTIFVLLPLAFSSSGAQQGGLAVGTPTFAKPEVKRNPALEAITLRPFQSMPPDQAREVFKSLSAETQCRLWRTKLAKTLASNQLDERQVGIIAMVDSILTPELYSGVRKASTKYLLEDLEAEARAAFTPDQFNSVFMFLGTPGTSQSSSYYHSPKIRMRRLVDCYCSTHSDYCGGGSTCKRGRCNVDPSGMGVGCGFLFLYICNGRCWR
jgi:hypothetical protein